MDSIKLIYAYLGMLVFVALLSSAVFGAQPADKLEKGSYFLFKSDPPEYLVTGIDLAQFSRIHFPDMQKISSGLAGGKWGRYYLLQQKTNNKQLKITAAVYSTTSIAENSVLDLLNDTSVVLKPGSQNGKAIGTHSWHFVSPSGSEIIVFTYANALFQIFSTNISLAESAAILIAEDLNRGGNGIRLGAKVFLPEVTNVTFTKDITPGITGLLHLIGKSEVNEELSFFVTAERGQILQTTMNKEKMYVSTGPGVDKLVVYAISNMCVVSKAFNTTIDSEKTR